MDSIGDNAPAIGGSIHRRQWMQLLSSGCLGLGLAATDSKQSSFAAALAPTKPVEGDGTVGRELHMRIGVETLRNPFWYAEQGYRAEADQFWDRDHWIRILRGWADEGYSHLVYWIEPWNKHAWSTFLIRHRSNPEAAELSVEQSERVIEQVSWLFGEAHKVGLMNLLFGYFIVTTPAFAKAHRHDRELPVSTGVDFRHNLASMGFHYGVRDEATRRFTETAIAELFETYEHLDGMYGAMGEAVPGKRSSWYPQAVVPGLKQCPRQPLFLVASWMQPFDEFLDEIAPKQVYENTWLAVHANAEVFTDAKPYPTYARWLERSPVPAVVEVMHHNFEAGFPFNSPRLAWEIVNECRKFAQCDGLLAWFSRDHPDDLMRKALAWYAKRDEPYSEAPWLDLLEERFGDREAAGHFLAAYDASARITPEVGALACVPHDLSVSRQLLLPYWYWTGQDARWNELASPSRAGLLLPVRQYARVVAQLGDQFRDNSGADPEKNHEHPGSQELMWGIGDYPITPEAHMRHVRRLGGAAFASADKALAATKKNADRALAVFNYMQAYKLLTDYYESKVLAAISALLFALRGGDSDKLEAEQFADLAVEQYEIAAQFIWQSIDEQRGAIKGRWLDGSAMTMPELIEREKRERQDLPKLFDWHKSPSHNQAATPAGTAPKAGTFAPPK